MFQTSGRNSMCICPPWLAAGSFCVPYVENMDSIPGWSIRVGTKLKDQRNEPGEYLLFAPPDPSPVLPSLCLLFALERWPIIMEPLTSSWIQIAGRIHMKSGGAEREVGIYSRGFLPWGYTAWKPTSRKVMNPSTQSSIIMIQVNSSCVCPVRPGNFLGHSTSLYPVQAFVTSLFIKLTSKYPIWGGHLLW